MCSCVQTYFGMRQEGTTPLKSYRYLWNFANVCFMALHQSNKALSLNEKHRLPKHISDH